MNVLMAGTDTVYSGVELAIYTLMNHNRNVNIYILNMDIDIVNEETHSVTHYRKFLDWQIYKLEKIVKYFDSNSNIKFIDCKEIYLHYLDNSVNRNSDFTPLAAVRLCADIFLPYLDNVLYLDCDTVVTGDLSDFYDSFSKKDITYGAYVVEDACEGEGEMISGVMFMNLAKMRRTGFLNRARDNYRRNLYRFPDQSAIRDAGGDFVKFSPDYGYCDNLDDFDGLPLIIHFTNKIEPKIYYSKSRKFFFKKFPFLKYANEGIMMLDEV